MGERDWTGTAGDDPELLRAALLEIARTAKATEDYARLEHDPSPGTIAERCEYIFRCAEAVLGPLDADLLARPTPPEVEPQNKGRYDDLSEKSRGYAEGVVAGFAAAQEAVEALTGGLLTLNVPHFVRQWDNVVRELRATRSRRSPDEAGHALRAEQSADAGGERGGGL